ncbi:MAG: GNAT family N-acetyltransferase [Chloroflexi bacterium]|nr:GNAT family N-acetyltransferase [Chloroflexota bacterium]
MAIKTQRDLQDFRTVVTLKDGSSLRLRAIRRDDEEKLIGLFYRLSHRAVYLRFHHVLHNLSREEAQRFAAVDYDNTFAIVATVGEGAQEKIVGVGRYARLPKRDVAEVSFTVENGYQGRGIGTHLMERLAGLAHEKGIRAFEAEVLAENAEMMNVFRDSGFTVTRQTEDGVYLVGLAITPTREGEEVSAEREKLATIASLMPLLTPRSIAVIGASRRSGSIGNKVFHNLLEQEFAGVVYPVNSHALAVASVKAYPTILDIPAEVDTAVLIVPAALVPGIADQCGRKGVRGLVVISAGFAESGPEGIERQKTLMDIVTNYGMRLVGPNCMGIINTAPDVSMNGTFSSVFPSPGKIAFATQSGALELAILEYARTLNLGLSTVVSIGNMADVSGVDLLQYWEEDPSTRVILLYLESFGDPRKFARVARRVAMTKPIIAVKSGRTPAGSRAAASHTGAMASTEVGVDALFTQAGIIRVDTLEALFDVANLLSQQPIPRGNRVAILTNGGGPGILTADACASEGLELPPISDGAREELRSFLPPGSNLTNPVDMTADGTAEQYLKALRLLEREDQFDIIIVIFIPPIATSPEAVAAAIREVAPQFRNKGRIVVASFVGGRGAPPGLGSEKEGFVPAFNFPEATAKALASAFTYGRWLTRPRGAVPDLKGIDRERARQVLKAASEQRPEGTGWISPLSAFDLLNCYGINTLPVRAASTPDEAIRAAEATGYPVAAKLLSATIAHKTEVRGVFLDLHTGTEVENAFRKLEERMAEMKRQAEMQGVMIQPMMTSGIEVIAGVTQDPAFGPLIMFGLGGIQAELFKDVTFKIHPLTNIDAGEMVRSVKAYQLLQGWRGAAPSDIAAIEYLLLRISAMVEDLPQIRELDLNPVKVFEKGKGYVVVDARIMLS